PEGIAVLGLLGALAFVAVTGKKSLKLTTAKMAGAKELGNARLKARKQRKNPQKNSYTLWIGSPTPDYPQSSLWIPDAQRSIAALGGPGSGKTFSSINPLIESALQQGIPVGIYDKKGDQLELFAPLAAQYGYEVGIFAPGEQYSICINPLDILHSPEDATGASELAKVLLGNSSNDKGDSFFTDAAVNVLKGLFQMAKSTIYPDFGMVYALLSLSNLVGRLELAVREEKMSRWIGSAFTQLISTKDSEKTVASIVSSATGMFSQFIEPDILRCLMGASTMPLRIEGKKIIIFKLNEARRNAVSPIIAAVIDSFVSANFAQGRQDPCVISLDELPSMYFEKLPYWINELRSAGSGFILGVQNMKQLYEKYGDNLGAAIFSACNTKMIFNPGEKEAAQEFSDFWGQTEINLKNKSVSHSKEGKSTSKGEQLQQKPLISVDDILGFMEGHCVITSSAYNDGKRANYPYQTKIHIPSEQIARFKKAEGLWQSVKQRLVTRSQLASNHDLAQQLEERISLAESLLPLPVSNTNDF
ncbi:type IV secretory system conjugative DNA transfer family protein, partial [Merismopedia glauca]